MNRHQVGLNSSAECCCNFCGAEAYSLCSGCRIAVYCGFPCQGKDWNTHRMFCGINNKGNQLHFRAQKTNQYHPQNNYNNKMEGAINPHSSTAKTKKTDLQHRLSVAANTKKEEEEKGEKSSNKEVELPAIEKLQIGTEQANGAKNKNHANKKKSNGKTSSQNKQLQQPNFQGNRGQNNLPMPSYNSWVDSNLQQIFSSQRARQQFERAKVQQKKSLMATEKANVEKAMETIKSEMPQNGTRAVITSFSSSNVVFLRSKVGSANSAYLKIEPEVRRAAKNLPKLIAPPKQGAIVVLFHQEQYLRGQILKVEPAIKVLLLESGTCCEVKLDDLREASDEIINLRRLVVPVKLKNVPLAAINKVLQNYLTDCVKSSEFIVTYDSAKDLNHTTSVYEVELTETKTNKNLNKTILQMIGGETKDNFDCELLQNDELPVGKVVNIYIVNNNDLKDGVIACSTEKIIALLNLFEEDIAKEISTYTETFFRPKVNELCFAKSASTGKWHRGRCIMVMNDEHYQIEFIDYLFAERVFFANIRHFANAFFFDKPTASCKIVGLPKPLSSEMVAELQKLLPPKNVLLCKAVVKSKTGTYSLLLPQVQKSISQISKEIAKRTENNKLDHDQE